MGRLILSPSPWCVVHIVAGRMEGDIGACFEGGNNFNNKLKDALTSLMTNVTSNKSEIDALRGDHDQLRKDHDALEVTTTRENDLRKNEVKSLEEKQGKDNQARVTDIAKLDGKLDSENGARKAEIAALDTFAKGENDARKNEIANLKNFADDEAAARSGEDKAINDRLDKEISDRESSNSDLQSRMDSNNDDRINDINDLRTKMMKENEFLRSLSGKTCGVYFNAYRTKAYDGGGEENLTFQGAYCNTGGALDTDTGIFTCPVGGTYMFQFHIATHDNKKSLLSIRRNGEEIASIFDQNHKDNHKNSMAGQNIIIDVKRGDEIVVYAYTGTWLADFPMNHYTHWVGLLLKPSEEEEISMRKSIEEGLGTAEAQVNGF